MLTNRDYVIFTLGAAIGAAVSYVFTKKKIEKECYDAYYAERHPEKERAEHDGDDVIITDTKKTYDRFREEQEENRQKARDIASENGYDSEEPNDFSGPYIIDESVYCAGDLGYANTRVNWYPGIGKATDETDNTEIDAITMCGLGNLNEIEENGQSMGYIRNDERREDIEVFICYAEWPLEDDEGGVKD